MPDGVELITDVFHPIGIERGPAIVERSGYGRMLMASLAEAFAERGYRYVLQTVRVASTARVASSTSSPSPPTGAPPPTGSTSNRGSTATSV